MLFKKLMSLLPRLCVLCGSASHTARNCCEPCQLALPILSHHCQQCAHILPVGDRCPTCQHNPPPFRQTYALAPYQAPIIHLITRLKFQHQLSHAQLLGDLLTSRIQQDWYLNHPLPDLIIPIPLHPQRLKARGFNQALEIARPIHKALTIPLDLSGSKRIKATAAQSSLTARERGQNMANAFHADRDYTGLHIAVLDDVITTGHTMRAFCQTLKQAGATYIDVWCCARAQVDIAPSPKNQ